ncbi:MAG: DUF58 domain-containing protein, partial [Nostocoides sp.]
MSRPSRLPPIPWHATAAGFRAGIVGACGVLAAVALHRPDLLVVATPFVVVATWGRVLRPTRPLVAEVDLPDREAHEGDIDRFSVSANLPRGADALTVGLVAGAFVEVDPSARTVTLGRAAGSVPQDQGADDGPGDPVARITFAVRTTRWGVRHLGPCSIGAMSPWAAYRAGPVEGPSATIAALPQPAVFDARAPMPAPRGMVGLDRSRRSGAGTEFAGIRAFQSGDRLRRIHWPSSLRTGSLNVTQTYADQESHVVVIVDATNDIGEREGIDGRPTSLDLTVRAAAALAEHHLARGDRFAVRAFGATGFPALRPRTGSAHLRSILVALGSIEVASARRVDAAAATRRLPDGALVVLLSPLLSDASFEVVGRLVAAGLAPVVVDTLPTDPGHGGTEWLDLAWRIR